MNKNQLIGVQTRVNSENGEKKVIKEKIQSDEWEDNKSTLLLNDKLLRVEEILNASREKVGHIQGLGIRMELAFLTTAPEARRQ